ncbi:MAG: DUF192 domain-containing protein [Patescibacteria group bacterium]
MKILNISKNVVVADEVLVAESFEERTRGLMGFNEPVPLFLKTRWGIHTFGMKFAIDCIVCGEDLEVKTVRENLLPRKFFFWSPKYENVFELPAGAILSTGTQVGDKLKLI